MYVCMYVLQHAGTTECVGRQTKQNKTKHNLT